VYRRKSETRVRGSTSRSRNRSRSNSRSRSRSRAVTSFFGDSDSHSDGNSDGEVARLRAEVAALQRENAVEQARHVSMDRGVAAGVATNNGDHDEAAAAEKSARRLSRSRLAAHGQRSKERRSRSCSKSRVASDSDESDDDWGVTHL
jgi:hypothetical protein